VDELRIERQVLEAEHQRLLGKLIDAPAPSATRIATAAAGRDTNGRDANGHAGGAPCRECDALREQLRTAGKRLNALQVQVNRSAIKAPNVGREQLELELERALHDAEAADDEVIRLQAQVQVGPPPPTSAGGGGPGTPFFHGTPWLPGRPRLC